MKEASTSHGDRMKADFEIIADRRYVLRSGIESAFTRGMLIGKYGFSRGGEITQRAYPEIWREACDRSIAEKMNVRAELEMVRY
ncbi:MAG: hypothetical protein AB1589_28045 [Cyanobacteriota bacterium]